MKTNCDIIRDLLPLYAEHITSEATNALVEEHLAECEACRAELEQMEQPVPVRPEAQPMRPCAGSGGLQRRSFRAQRTVLAALCALALIFWMGTARVPATTEQVSSGPITAKRMVQTSAFWKRRARGSGWIWRTPSAGASRRSLCGPCATAFRACIGY